MLFVGRRALRDWQRWGAGGGGRVVGEREREERVGAERGQRGSETRERERREIFMGHQLCHFDRCIASPSFLALARNAPLQKHWRALPLRRLRDDSASRGRRRGKREREKAGDRDSARGQTENLNGRGRLHPDIRLAVVGAVFELCCAILRCAASLARGRSVDALPVWRFSDAWWSVQSPARRRELAEVRLSLFPSLLFLFSDFFVPTA